MRYPSFKTGPSPKEIVFLLCEHLGEEDKVVLKKDGTQVAENNLVHECPKEQKCYNAGIGSKKCITKSKGYRNGVSHLKKCVSHGDCKHFASEYDSNLTSKQHFIGETFNPRLNISDKESEIISWIELIIDEGLPLRTVEK